MTSYLAAGLRELTEHCDVTVVLTAPVTTPARYTAGLNIRFAADMSRADYVELLRRRFDLTLHCGWHVPAYRRFAVLNALRRRQNLLFFDNRWSNSRRQQLFAALPVRFVLRCIYPRAIVPGPAQIAYCLRLGYDDRSITTGGYTFDAGVFEAVETPIASRPAGFLFAGRLAPEKGLEWLLEGYERYAATVRDPWPLNIAGAGSLAHLFENRAGVQLSGHLSPDELADAMRRNRCFVLTSLREPWGVVAQEAAAAGLPLILSDQVGAATTVLQAGVNGALVECGNAAALAAAFEGVHKTSPTRLAMMSSASRSLAAALRPAHWAASVVSLARMSPPRQSNSVVWLTNVPASYRYGLWRDLAHHRLLTVICMSPSEANQNWPDRPDVSPASLRILNCRALNQDSVPFYLPSWSLGRELRRARPAAIYIDGWHSPAYWQAMLSVKLRRGRVVLGYRSRLEDRRFARGPVAWIRQTMLRTADAVVASGADSRAAVEACGVDSNRIIIATNVADAERIIVHVERARAAAPESRHVPGHAFLYVGQLIARKNLESLLVAFQQIKGHGDRLTIIGGGPLEQTLRDRIEHLGLRGQVELVGHKSVEAVWNAYSTHCTLVLPSLEEIWGLVVNEAIAAGLNVVVSRRAGVSRAVEGRTGVWITEPSANALAEGMRESRDGWTQPLPVNARSIVDPEDTVNAFLQALMPSPL